jgi:hypothetical protein
VCVSVLTKVKFYNIFGSILIESTFLLVLTHCSRTGSNSISNTGTGTVYLPLKEDKTEENEIPVCLCVATSYT